MVFARLRELLGESSLPPGTDKLLSTVEDTGELLRGLDDMVTRNEVAVSELNKQLAALEQLEGEEKQKVQGGGLGARTRAAVLRHILRLRQQMDQLEDRLKIHDRNIRLHLDLIGTLKQIEAMGMAGVNEKEVDGIILRFGEELKSYQASLTSGEVLGTMEKTDVLPGEEDLSSLEAEIIGEVASEKPAEKAVEKPLPEQPAEPESSRGPAQRQPPEQEAMEE